MPWVRMTATLTGWLAPIGVDISFGRAQPSTHGGTMANQRNAVALILIGSFALLVGGAGLYLGFKSDQTPYYHGPPVPKVPDHGPFLYSMRSIWSEPNRV